MREYLQGQGLRIATRTIRRIAIIRQNISELIEQAAAYSGAEDEERNADRIAQQEQELAKLIELREALLRKYLERRGLAENDGPLSRSLPGADLPQAVRSRGEHQQRKGEEQNEGWPHVKRVRECGNEADHVHRPSRYS